MLHVKIKEVEYPSRGAARRWRHTTKAREEKWVGGRGDRYALHIIWRQFKSRLGISSREVLKGDASGDKMALVKVLGR